MRTFRIAAGLAAVCAFAVPAHAQPRAGAFPTLQPGQSVSGTIAQTDPAMYERGRFKVYQFQASPGRRYIVTMESGDFDAFLTLGRTVGGVTDHMLTNDDSGEGTGSRLRFTVPAAGTYLVIAQSLSEEGTGAFTLGLDTATIRPPVVQNLTLGQTVEGELSEGDAEYEEAEMEGFYDLYRVRASEGQRVRVVMEFGEEYPMVEVGTMENGQFTAMEDVSVTGGGRVSFTAPAAGDYYIRAGAYGGIMGSYTLAVEERRPAPPPVTTPIRAGATATGELEEGDAELEDGRWYDEYSFTGQAGQRIRVDLSSEDVDSFLIVGRMTDGQFEELASNDDAEDGDDLDSAVVLELPASGQFLIRATSFSPESEGAYQLTVATP